jgi:hypothetical protein
MSDPTSDPTGSPTASPTRALAHDLVHAQYPDVELGIAFYRGAATILLAIAATLTVVGAILAACGCGLWCLLIGAPVLLPAAACAGWAKVLRAAR